jgi:hypothetical protein
VLCDKPRERYNTESQIEPCFLSELSEVMSKTQRKLKKANHGRRPASSKARLLKRRKFRT